MEKQARWLINPDGYYPYCSNCRHEPKDGAMSKYCPECGFRMNLSSQHSTVVLDGPAQEKIDDLITTSIATLVGFPNTYCKDIIWNNLSKIQEILEANK